MRAARKPRSVLQQPRGVDRHRGGIKGPITVLNEGSEEAQLHAAGALRTFGEESQNQDVTRDEGVIQAFIKVLHEGS